MKAFKLVARAIAAVVGLAGIVVSVGLFLSIIGIPLGLLMGLGATFFFTWGVFGTFDRTKWKKGAA